MITISKSSFLICSSRKVDARCHEAQVGDFGDVHLHGHQWLFRTIRTVRLLPAVRLPSHGASRLRRRHGRTSERIPPRRARSPVMIAMTQLVNPVVN